MGTIISLIASATFCLERVLQWTCCALLLTLFMLIMILLMAYGISIGYHYAQKELATFAMWARANTPGPPRRRSGDDDRPVVRLLAVNRTDDIHPRQPIIETYETLKPDAQVFVERTETPIVVLERDKLPTRTPRSPIFSANEQALARKLISRFRRSRNNTSSSVIPFLRPLRGTLSTLLTTMSAINS